MSRQYGLTNQQLLNILVSGLGSDGLMEKSLDCVSKPVDVSRFTF